MSIVEEAGLLSDDRWWAWVRSPHTIKAGVLLAVSRRLREQFGRPVTVEELFEPVL
jgi:hypothetical protein